jgi:hypothetical protein
MLADWRARSTPVATLNPVPLITGIRPPPLHHSPYNFQILGGVREYISPVPPAATIAAIGWWRSARRFVLNPAISARQVGVKGSDRKSNYALEFCAELFCSHALANLQSGGAIASYPSDTLWPPVGLGATKKLRLLSTLTSKPVSAKS